MSRNGKGRLGPRDRELVERLDGLRRHADAGFDLAQRSEDIVEALRRRGLKRTADAFDWRRRVYLRDLSAWIREINDAETVVLADVNIESPEHGRTHRDESGTGKGR